MKKQFGEGLIFTISNYTIWFFLGSTYFIITNIPLIFAIVILKANISSIEITFLTSIFIGPAFCALLASMGKLQREKDIHITKEYFKAYKNNFLQAIILTALEVVCLFIVYIDIFTNKHTYEMPMSTWILIIIAVIIVTIGMFAFPILSRFYLPIKDVIMLSIKYMVKRPKVTIVNILILICIALFMYSLPSIAMLFAISIMCFFIMENEKDVLKDIEDTYSK